MKKLALLALLPIFAACDPAQETVVENASKNVNDTIIPVVQESPTISVDQKYNDLAQFLAGIEGSENSGLKTLESENSSFYQKIHGPGEFL